MSATQPVGGVTTRHEFVMKGWTKALVSADHFCRLQTSTSNRQPNGHDHGKVPEPTARAEVWREVFLPASLTPPAEECTGAIRSFCPNCCLLRSVGWDPTAATQGGQKSKGWPQDRLSLGMGRGWRDSSRGFTTALWAPPPISGKRHRRETPRQGYTTTTAYTRNHWNSFILSLFLASRVHMCAVSDRCVCHRFNRSGCGVRPTGRLCTLRACRRALLRSFSVAFFSLAHCVTECVLQFFMAQWFPARLCSAAGALRRAQQHETRKSPGTSFSEFSSQSFTEQHGNAYGSSFPCQ